MGRSEARPGAAPALAVLGAAALFGTTGTAQALGPAGTTPLGIGAVRLAIGGAVLCALAAARPLPGGRAWGRHAPALLLAGVGVAAYQLCWFAGMRRTGVALGTIVGIGSGPVFAGLIHLFTGGKGPSRSWLVGTGLTLAGSALLAWRGGGGGSAHAGGLALMLGAGLSYAVYTHAAKRAIERGLDAAGAMAGAFGAGAALLAPLLLVEPLGWLATGRGAAMALHLGALTIGLAYLLYGWGLRFLPVHQVVTLTLAEPLTAAILGTALLGERLPPAGWAGAALVAAGLAWAGGAAPEAG